MSNCCSWAIWSVMSRLETRIPGHRRNIEDVVRASTRRRATPCRSSGAIVAGITPADGCLAETLASWRSTRGRSSGWTSSSIRRPISQSGSAPIGRAVAAFAYSSVLLSGPTRMISEEAIE